MRNDAYKEDIIFCYMYVELHDKSYAEIVQIYAHKA